MSLSKMQNLKELNASEIEQEIIKVEKNLFDLRLKKATRQNFKSHEFKHLKHKKAQLLTILNSIEN